MECLPTCEYRAEYPETDPALGGVGSAGVRLADRVCCSSSSLNVRSMTWEIGRLLLIRPAERLPSLVWLDEAGVVAAGDGPGRGGEPFSRSTTARSAGLPRPSFELSGKGDLEEASAATDHAPFSSIVTESTCGLVFSRMFSKYLCRVSPVGRKRRKKLLPVNSKVLECYALIACRTHPRLPQH